MVLNLCMYLLNVFFFNPPPSTSNYATTWLSILILQSRQGLVRLLMQFIMAGTQIVYNTSCKCLFAGYKDGGVEKYCTVQYKYKSIHQQGPLQRSKRVQFASLLIDSTRSIYACSIRR